MVGKWKYLPISEFVTHQKGFAFKSKDYQSDGCPVVRVSNFTSDSIDDSDLRYVSEGVANTNRAVELKENDVIISTVGSWPKNPASVVGKTIRVPSIMEGGLLNQNAVRLRVKSDEKYEQVFLFYLLKNKDFSDYIVSTAQGSANQASITLKDIFAYRTHLPPKKQRTQIARCIGAVDKKIELNRQVNETLEQMAQALFKSWFVDFDPVIDNALDAGNLIPEELEIKAEQRKQLREAVAKGEAEVPTLPDDIRSLFPSEFEFTEEMGWIPKGWNAIPLKELIDISHGFAFKGEHFSEEPTNDILLTPGNVKAGGGFKSEKLKYYSGPVQEDYIFQQNDLFVTMTDLSKAGDTLGYPALVPHCDRSRFLHNQRLGRVLLKTSEPLRYFIYQCLCTKAYRAEVLGNATGSTVKHTAPKKILAHVVAYSGGRLESCFERFCGPWAEKKALNDQENGKLVRLRDLLLPKLISGELQIPEALN